jgi:hypothetical protein
MSKPYRGLSELKAIVFKHGVVVNAKEEAVTTKGYNYLEVPVLGLDKMFDELYRYLASERDRVSKANIRLRKRNAKNT